jgi:hypothetical protein
MVGETDLFLLLKSMEPILYEGEYVFCSVDPEEGLPFIPDSIGIFREEEGLTLVLSRDCADTHNLSYSSVFRCVILWFIRVQYAKLIIFFLLNKY